MKRIRVVKNTNFTTINNEFIFNKDMSLKAKGLLCHLLALPNDWKLYVEEVEKHHKDGKASIYSSFKELTDNGYMKREQIRENGKFKGYDYVVFEKPYTEKPNTEKPNTEKPYTENQPLLKTNNTKDLIKVNTNNTKTQVLSFPIELNIEAWELWKEFRKTEYRKSYKTLGEKAAIGKLLKIAGDDKELQKEVLLQSMENGWIGLFPIKTEKKSKAQEILSEYQKGINLINQQYND